METRWGGGQKKDIKSLALEQMKEELGKMGEKPFRAKQIYGWLHEKLAESFEEMTNLSKSLRESLEAAYFLPVLKAVRVQESKTDGTKKFLFALPDGNLVETVWMKYHHGNSVCISSQVGCRMGCKFCASTLDGLERSLLPSEMLEQVYAVTRLTGERVSNVVIMGSGEPLDNYDNVVIFVKLLSAEEGLHISQRNITISTCGLVPEMEKLAKERLQITLAISLHASNNEKRKEIMPIANRYSLETLLAACRTYGEKTGRRITFEYSLIDGVNDSPEEAKELSEQIQGLLCHVNLIPVNPVKERGYAESSRAKVLMFKNLLEKNRINVTIRREMGRDIDGACGQLRRRHIKEGEKT